MNEIIEQDAPRVEPAALEDLPQLVELVMVLLEGETDFQADREKQEHGLRLILEQPNRGRIFVVRNDFQVIGMVNLLFTISTAAGGLALNLEDVIIHPEHRRQGYGTMLVDHMLQFAADKSFRRITLLTDRISEPSQRFFAKHGFTPSEMLPMRRMIEIS